MRTPRVTFNDILLCMLFAVASMAARATDAPPEKEAVAAPAAKAPDTLTFISYNVLADPVETETRVPALLKLLEESKADVIALQEVAPWFLKKLNATAWTRNYHASTTINDTAAGGLYLLSKWPLKRTRIQAVPSRQGRALLIVELDVGGSSIGVATCHLESPLADHDLRTQQLKLAQAKLKDYEHAVFLGDFNFGDGEQPESDTISPFEDAWKKLKPKDAGFTWNKEASEMAAKGSFPNEASRRIDRVLIRSKTWTAVQAQIIGDRPLKPGSKALFPSDHFGLRVVYKLASAGK